MFALLQVVDTVVQTVPADTDLVNIQTSLSALIGAILGYVVKWWQDRNKIAVEPR